MRASDFRKFWSEIFSLRKIDPLMADHQQVQQHQGEHRPFLGRSHLQDVIALYYDAKEQHTLSDDVVAALKA